MEIKNINNDFTMKLSLIDNREVEFYKVDEKKVHLSAYIRGEKVLDKTLSIIDFTIILRAIADFHEDRVRTEIDKIKNGNLTYEKRNKIKSD